jgi:hypothetical protein
MSAFANREVPITTTLPLLPSCVAQVIVEGVSGTDMVPLYSMLGLLIGVVPELTVVMSG